MAAKSYLHLDASFPVGIRRNNPGNLAKGRAAYPGLTTRPDTGRGPLFLAFVSVPYGIAAMIVLMQAYLGPKGLNTIARLAKRYAPASEGNNTALWIKQVALYSGLGATQALSPTNPQQVKALVMGIIKKEVGLVWRKGPTTATITLADYDEAVGLLTANQIAYQQTARSLA